MPRDYAKSTPRKPGRPRSESASTPGWIWLFTGIFLGLFIGGLAYLNKHSNSTHLTKTETVTKTATSKPTAETAPQTHQPRFDFYTMLPQNQTQQPAAEGEHTPSQAQQLAAQSTVSPDDEAVSPAEPATTSAKPAEILPAAVKPAVAPTTVPKPATVVISRPAPKTAVTAKESYILTVAALKNYQDADQLKAQLSLLGFDVHIKAVKVNNATLQRVWLGPYSSFAAAEKEQRRLNDNHFKSLLVKQTP